MAFSKEFEADLEDPMLKNDINLSKETLSFLEANVEKCFLCKWMLADYKEHGTFTGVIQKGEFQSYEIFPIRGEVNHLWLELHGKPYPFKAKLSKHEAAPSGYAPNYSKATFVMSPDPVAPLSRPGVVAPPPAPEALALDQAQVPAQAPEPPAEVVKDIATTPVAKPRRG